MDSSSSDHPTSPAFCSSAWAADTVSMARVMQVADYKGSVGHLYKSHTRFARFKPPFLRSRHPTTSCRANRNRPAEAHRINFPAYLFSGGRQTGSVVRFTDFVIHRLARTMYEICTEPSPLAC